MIFFYVLPRFAIKRDHVACSVNDNHFIIRIEMVLRVKPISVER